MSISAAIKALLSITGHKQSDLMDNLKVNSKQALSNKFTGERWSASDLVKIAESTGCQLCFISPDGKQRIILNNDPVNGGTLGEMGVSDVGGVNPPTSQN